MRTSTVALLSCCAALAACDDSHDAVQPDGGDGQGPGGPDAYSSGDADGGMAGGDSDAGPVPDASVEAGVDPYSGPFKILVLSKTITFHHDSIPAGQQMLRDLGACFDASSCAATNDVAIPGAQPNSSFTVDAAGAPANAPPHA